MLEATQRKLREATFFFGWMTEEISSAFKRNDPENFLYYLSAFLGAGRSVTFAAQCEEKGKYDAWYTGWLESCTDEERKIWRFMNAQRVEEVHRRGAETTSGWELVPLGPTDFDNRYHPAYHIFLCAPPDTPVTKIGRTSHKFNLGAEGGEVDVIEACQRYLALLQRFIRDFMGAPEAEETTEAIITRSVPPSAP